MKENDMAMKTVPEIDPYDRDTVAYVRAFGAGDALVDRVRRLAAEVAGLKQQVRESEELIAAKLEVHGYDEAAHAIRNRNLG